MCVVYIFSSVRARELGLQSSVESLSVCCVMIVSRSLCTSSYFAVAEFIGVIWTPSSLKNHVACPQLYITNDTLCGACEIPDVQTDRMPF